MLNWKFACIALLVGTSAPAAASQIVSLNVPAEAAGAFSGKRSKDTLVVQVLLDRSRFSPGVVDGMVGGNTRRAIRAFERANGLPEDGAIDPELMRTLLDQQSGDIFQPYTVTSEDVDGPFREVPEGMAAKAKLEKLSYETPLELLAEKFHMSQALLKALNPGADFSKQGTELTVIVPGSDDLQTEIARIEVDKAKNSVRAYSSTGELVARYPATIGSESFPSPDGSMEVRAVAPEPNYYFNPEGRDWGPDRRLTIAAGPNNPVGSTWIDLTKEGYGIHGTPEPKLIGKTSSHGCVRLTNWDAEELAKGVRQGTKVVFLET